MQGFLPKKVKIKFIRSDLCGMLRERFRGYPGSESVQPYRNCSYCVHIIGFMAELHCKIVAFV